MTTRLAERIPARHLRIFLSSPSDMREEWELATRLVNRDLPKRPHLRGRVTFDLVCWKDEHAPLTMDAGKRPQPVVDERVLPSECDIVVVTLWSRMGTPPKHKNKPDGEPYASGTEWEFEEAIAAQRACGAPRVWVYKKAEPVPFLPGAPDFDEKVAQARSVELFTARIAECAGINTYKTPREFEELLRYALEEYVDGVPQLTISGKPPGAAPGLHLETRIQNFVEEYLSRDQQACPVPFGGRDPEFARLDSWLENHEGPARCLVSAPAGRGKSALLVRWLERLKKNGRIANAECADENSWSVAFVPISIRFQTNLPENYYRAFAERLARFAGTCLQTPAIDPADYYRDRVTELLRDLGNAGTQVLLVIDGLDEALGDVFNGDVIPKRLPWNIRVLVSARWLLGDTDESGWLRRLDWATHLCMPLRLARLDVSAICNVLANIGAPVMDLAKDADLVTSLAELTEGEPLLLRYYVQDLWGLARDGRGDESKAESVARITRADLDNLKPGFGAYFDRWIQQQQAYWKATGECIDLHAVDSVLMILAFAYGPLESTDLVAVLHSLPNRSVVILIERLLEPLRRFVIGTGRPGEGYVLAHARIGTHLQEARFRSASSLMHQAFVAWGRRITREVNDVPEDAPRTPAYLLQFYRRHLEAVDAPLADFMTLVEDGWRRAWEHYECSQQGFSADVQAAWRRARRQGDGAEIGAQLRCILVLSSVRSLNYNMARTLLVAAVKRDALTMGQARHLAQFMDDKTEYVATLRDLATQCTVDVNLRTQLLEESLVSVAQINGAPLRAEALSGLAPLLGVQQLSTALRCANNIGEDSSRAKALSSLASYLNVEQLGDVLAALKAIADGHSRAKALIELIRHLHPEQLDEALAVATTIDHHLSRIKALNTLLPRLTGRPRVRALSLALAAVASIGSDRARAEALREIAPQLDAKGLAEALSMARVIGSEYWRVVALSWLVPFLPHLQQIELRRRLASYMKKPPSDLDTIANAPALKSRVLSAPTHVCELGTTTTSPEDPNAELLYAKAINDVFSQAELLIALGPNLDLALRPAAYGEVLAAARVVADEFQRAHILVGLAPLLEREQLDEVLATVNAIDDEGACSLALTGLAPHLGPEQLNQVLAMAKTPQSDERRAALLTGIGRRLAAHQLEDALAIVKLLQFDEVRMKTLAELAPYLGPQQLGEVLAASMLARSDVYRAGILIKLATYLEPADRVLAYAEALSAANSVECDSERAALLQELAPHLEPEQCEEALRAAKAISDKDWRDVTVDNIERRRKGAARAQVSSGGQSATNSVDDEEVVPFLSGILAYEAPEHVVEALEAAKGLSDEDDRARALSSLAPHLKRAQKAEALEAATGIRRERSRAKALGGLAPHLETEQLTEALVALLRTGDRLTRAELLAALSPFVGAVKELGGQEALKGLHQALRDVVSWYP